MRLVVRNRLGAAAAGMGRHYGSGFFGSLGRKLLSAGFRKEINVAKKANLSQKLADVIVNGAKTAGEKLGKKGGKRLGAVVRKKLTNTFAAPPPRPKKRPREGPATTKTRNSNGRFTKWHDDKGLTAAKRRKFDRFINHRVGSGIILQ